MDAPLLLEPAQAYALWAPTYPPHAHNPVMQAEERAMLGLLPRSLQGRVVLDAGCGSGRYLLHARHRGASHAIGVDMSPQMLRRAATALSGRHEPPVELLCGSLTALPLGDDCADFGICGLALGHVRHLQAALAELSRVVRPGGRVLCSDVHPIGDALGWVRDFSHDGSRYAVRHTRHLYSHWHAACAAYGLVIEHVLEPMLDPADIPAGAHFDHTALEVPVALVLQLRRARRHR